MERKQVLQLNTRRGLHGGRREAEHPIYTMGATLGTLLLLVLVYIIFRAAPFGDRQIFQIDQFHQYSPFMADLRRRLLSGGSLLYNWHGGLGYNLWASIGYYLASPFNLFLILFPPEHLADAVTFLTALKLSLMAGAMQAFLARSFKRAPLISVPFGMAYALSTYVMAYSWNIMWMDVLLFLPLAALGLVRLVQGRGRILYITALALMIWSNFYLAGFACAFLLLFYPVVWARFAPAGRRGHVGQALKSFLDFTLSSILAAGLTAVLLIPTVLNLGLTSAADDNPPRTFSFFHDAILILGRMYPFTKPAVMSGLPNLYVGLAPMLLLPLYLGNGKIPRAARTLSAVLLAFLFISFNNNWLNFAWHAFHYPNSLNHRFAFLFGFLLLFMAFDALVHTEDIPRGQLGMTAGILMITGMVIQMTDSGEDTAGMSHQALIATAIALPLLVSGIGHFVREREPLKLRLSGLPRGHRRDRVHQKMTAVAIPLCIALIAELTANMFYSHYERNKNSGYGPKEGYAYGQRADELRELSATIAKDYPHELIRAEVVPPLTTNDGAIYDLPGLSIFASTYPEAPIKFFRSLGYRTNGVNSIAYRGSPVHLDALLGIRYVANKDQTWYPETPYRKLIRSGEKVDVYEHADARSIGFATAGDPGTLSISSMQPVDAQNALYKVMGAEGSVLEQIMQIEMYSEEDGDTGRPLDPHVDLSGHFAISGETVYFRTDVHEPGYYLAIWDSRDADVNGVTLYLPDGGEERIASHRDGMQELGYFEGGTEIKLRFDQKDAKDATLNVYLARLNTAVYDAALETLDANRMIMSEWAGSRFTAGVEARADGHLMLMIPPDPGWHYTLDDEPVEPEDVEGALTAIPVTEGIHRLEGRFTPRGFREGFGISLGSLLLFALLIVITRNRRRRGRVLRIRTVRGALPEALPRRRLHANVRPVVLADDTAPDPAGHEAVSHDAPAPSGETPADD